MTIGEIIDEMRRLSQSLDKALDELWRASREAGEADADYRQAWALAFLQAEGPVKHREALADSQTNEERRRRNLTDAVRLGALEAVRSRRTQISALQSALNAHKAEAMFAATGPDHG